MIGLLGKLTLGHFRRHRLEAFLCLAGVTLGVAVVIAIDSAVAACVSSFQGAVQSLAERSTHSVFAEDGTIADDVYLDLVRRRLPNPLAPAIDRGVLVADGSDGVVGRLIGVDVFSERAFRSFTQMQNSLDKETLRTFLTEPSQVVLVDALASRLHANVGDTLHLTIGSGRADVRVAGIIHPAGVARSQLTNLIVADLATAQELTGALGRLDRIDTVLESTQQEQDFARLLPPGLVLRSTRQQSTSLEQLIGSYKLNLNALSLMASFVAVFIVYNSMLISVRQRLTSLGILRCLGGSRMQLGAIYAIEASIVSLTGGVLGVLLGWWLSRGMVGLVATTINDLYATVRPGPVTLGATAFVKGLAVSTGSCLIGAMIPLVQASRTPPVNAFRQTQQTHASGRAAVKVLVVGMALLACAYAVYRVPGESPIAGFVMAAMVAMGFALICPWVTRTACQAVARAARPLQALPAQMAAVGVGRSLGITGVAVAAMMLAMAMNVSVRTMVRSFRASLDQWVAQRFAADVFVGPELLVNHRIEATLDPAVERWVRSQPQVRRVVEYRVRDIPFGNATTMLVGTEAGELLGANTLPIKRIDSRRAYDPAKDVLISEPLAGRAKLDVGSAMTVSTPSGPRRFDVYAVFYEFGNERGQLMLDRRTYAAAWRDQQVNSMQINLVAGSNPEQVAADWTGQLRPKYPIVVNSFSNVRNEVLTVFDRTFKVTDVLTWLAGGVAFCGLSGSLLALALARQRDYSLLAAIGMSSRQTAAWLLGQGFLIAWVSAAVASVAGTVLAYVLSYVIQYRSFGWSIPTHAQPRFWVENLVLATAAAMVAAIYPAWRLRSIPPAGGLRQE